MPELSKELTKDSVKNSIVDARHTLQEKYNALSSDTKAKLGKARDRAVEISKKMPEPMRNPFIAGSIGCTLVSAVLFKTGRPVFGTLAAIAAPCLLAVGIFQRLTGDVKETEERKVAYH